MPSRKGYESEELKRFYTTWVSIRQRCNDRKYHAYSRYGGRGIKCEWEKFRDFKSDMLESFFAHIQNHGLKNTTIDRINNNSNYCKTNCRWATWEIQNNNRRDNRRITFNGKTHTLANWAKELDIKPTCLQYHLNSGMSLKRALQSKNLIPKFKKMYDQRP